MRLMTWREEKRKREEWWQEKYGVTNKERLEQWKKDVAEVATISKRVIKNGEATPKLRSRD